MQVDGKPFFPIGYYTSTCPSSVEDARDYLTSQHAQGMNTALSCYSIWGCGDSVMTNEVRGRCARRYEGRDGGQQIRRGRQSGLSPSVIDDQVDLLKDYPNMLGWYLFRRTRDATAIPPSVLQAEIRASQGPRSRSSDIGCALCVPAPEPGAPG